MAMRKTFLADIHENKKALLQRYLLNIFGSKAVFCTLLPDLLKTLYFAPPDYSGFAFIAIYFVYHAGYFMSIKNLNVF